MVQGYVQPELITSCFTSPLLEMLDLSVRGITSSLRYDISSYEDYSKRSGSEDSAKTPLFGCKKFTLSKKGENGDVATDEEIRRCIENFYQEMGFSIEKRGEGIRDVIARKDNTTYTLCVVNDLEKGRILLDVNYSDMVQAHSSLSYNFSKVLPKEYKILAVDKLQSSEDLEGIPISEKFMVTPHIPPPLSTKMVIQLFTERGLKKLGKENCLLFNDKGRILEVEMEDKVEGTMFTVKELPAFP